jgi:hypothetical protein
MRSHLAMYKFNSLLNQLSVIGDFLSVETETRKNKTFPIGNYSAYK